MRHINELKRLPVSELTDEEIVKAAMHRLKAKAIMLVYESEERLIFLGRYGSGGRHFMQQLKWAWEEKFGKLEKLDKEEDK